MSLCRFLAFCHDFIVFIFKLCDVHNGARQHLCISSIVDAVFAHHLTDHDFNVFIVDFNALGFIDTEYLLHEVVTRSGRPADTQDIVRIEGPFGQAVAHFHMIAVGNMKFGPIWNMVGIFRAIFAGDDDKTAIFLFLDADGSCRFAEDTRMFRFPCFEELLTRGRPWVISSAPATPPVWNVRIVSWVPGSPMAWAAMVPTASPISTLRAVARLRP